VKQIVSLVELMVSSKKSNSLVASENKLLKFIVGYPYSWNEISEVHRVRHGIYQRGGRLISLLTDFGSFNACYPDAHGKDKNTILYTGAGRRGDQPLDSFNRAMFNAIETAHAVPLFNKLAIGHWEFLGFWRVASGKHIFNEQQKRMIWSFTLIQQPNKD
jgi:hypothetical protein